MRATIANYRAKAEQQRALASAAVTEKRQGHVELAAIYDGRANLLEEASIDQLSNQP